MAPITGTLNDGTRARVAAYPTDAGMIAVKITGVGFVELDPAACRSLALQLSAAHHRATTDLSLPRSQRQVAA